jgi:hypothetical protein
MRDSEEQLNSVSEVIGGIDLISNSTDKKRKKIIGKLKDVIADLRAIRKKIKMRKKIERLSTNRI